MKHIDKIIRTIVRALAIFLDVALAVAAFTHGNLYEGLAWLFLAFLTLAIFSMLSQNARAMRLISKLLEINRKQDEAWAKCVADLTDKLCDAMGKVADDIKGHVALVDDHVKEIIHD